MKLKKPVNKLKEEQGLQNHFGDTRPDLYSYKAKQMRRPSKLDRLDRGMRRTARFWRRVGIELLP